MKIENTNYVDYLIELSQDGRKRAYLDLCELNLKNVFTVAYRLVANYEATEKIVLKIFFWGWDNIKEYGSNLPFSLWIKNLTIRHSINELKQMNVPKAALKERGKCTSELDYLESLIAALPLDERIIFVLHDLEGYSYNEIHNFLKGMDLDEIKTKLINTREYLMSEINL